MKTRALLALLAAATIAGACASEPTGTTSRRKNKAPGDTTQVAIKPEGAGAGDPDDEPVTPGAPVDPGPVTGSSTPPEDPLDSLPHGAGQLATVCGRGETNIVTTALCGSPALGSLVDLQKALGLQFVDISAAGKNGAAGNPAFVVLGHSTSLVVRSVSAINPRAIVFTTAAGATKSTGFVALGFARGEHFVELAAHDKVKDKLTFYLLAFDQACTQSKSCNFGDVLTPAVEKNWTGWHLYDDEDLKNTILDCRHCHQPAGPTQKPGLRMQEFRDPWTHWFRNDNAGGVSLLADYRAAHGTEEDYGPIPASLIAKSDGRALEDLVGSAGFAGQPNPFDSKVIEKEVVASSGAQPANNVPMGVSPTWQRAYDISALGGSIPVPYHDVKVTDAGKLFNASEAYKGFLTGTVAELPDIRRVFLTAGLPDMTIRPKVGIDGKAILVQMCGQCHNPNLDQTISRARFDVTKLDSMERGAKDAAIARMQMPATSKLRMPPVMLRSLTDEALDLAVLELMK